ncbi:MAG TPA: CAP domain-containing protein, partial [Steroidobacteraceae bacterium]
TGVSPDAALQAVDYAHQALATFHLTSDAATADALLRHLDCHQAADPKLHEFGLYQRGGQAWLMLAGARGVTPAGQNTILAAQPAPSGKGEPLAVSRQVELINAARARGARCGTHALSPAPPVHLSTRLSEVALGHALDMAQHHYFDHADPAGRSPADRVRASGYRETLVGENIAYGPKSADEVVRGWLDSPGHCENIMDVRFSEVGLAYASGSGSKPGLYWVQVFAAPRT